MPARLFGRGCASFYEVASLLSAGCLTQRTAERIGCGTFRGDAKGTRGSSVLFNAPKAERETMSDDYTPDTHTGTEHYEAPDTGSDAYNVDANHNSYDLDHGHAASGYDSDHNVDANQYGQASDVEKDTHFNQGHAVEYDSPNQGHYEEQDYTNLDQHEAASSASFGSQFSENDHNQAFQEIEQLQEHLESGHFSATGLEDGGGQQELSAVDK
jgi:hypothetical protein